MWASSCEGCGEIRNNWICQNNSLSVFVVWNGFVVASCGHHSDIHTYCMLLASCPEVREELYFFLQFCFSHLLNNSTLGLSMWTTCTLWFFFQDKTLTHTPHPFKHSIVFHSTFRCDHLEHLRFLMSVSQYLKSQLSSNESVMSWCTSESMQTYTCQIYKCKYFLNCMTGRELVGWFGKCCSG